jgi:hypothetical protein
MAIHGRSDGGDVKNHRLGVFVAASKTDHYYFVAGTGDVWVIHGAQLRLSRPVRPASDKNAGTVIEYLSGGRYVSASDFL